MNTQSLTFTRFIAAICVVIYHFGNYFPFNTTYLKPFFSHSDIFVSYFFFLSGFVMLIAYYTKIKSNNFNKLEYLIKRFARIYPLYFFALMLFIIQVVLFWDKNISIIDLLLNLFLIQSWQNDTALALNHPGWTLSVEFFFYATFPVLIAVMMKLSAKNNLILYSLVWFISQGISFAINKSYHPIIHLNSFWGGILLAKVLKEIERDNKLTWVKQNSNKILCFSVFIFVALVSIPNQIVDFGHNGLFTPIFAVIVLGIIYSDNIVTRAFSHPWFVYLGEISFGVYILQYPLYIFTSIFVRYLNNKFDKFLYSDLQGEFYIFLLVLVSFSAFAYHAIEKPIKLFILKKHIL